MEQLLRRDLTQTREGEETQVCWQWAVRVRVRVRVRRCERPWRGPSWRVRVMGTRVEAESCELISFGEEALAARVWLGYGVWSLE
jgi:hypothetical protein